MLSIQMWHTSSASKPGLSFSMSACGISVVMVVVVMVLVTDAFMMTLEQVIGRELVVEKAFLRHR